MYKSIQRFTVALILMIGMISTIVCQDNEHLPDINQITNLPQSPEVAAFIKHGNVPISMYTGSANITVPVGNITGTEMSIPVSFNYDGSGVKVEQQATWAGLGWNLNLGGVVSRQVAGIPDGYAPDRDIWDNLEMFNYMKNNNLIKNTFHTLARRTQYYQMLIDNEDQTYDMQPDLFPFSINGLSGTIAIDYEATPYKAFCIDNPKIKVDFAMQSVGGGVMDIDYFIITGEDGTKYYFEQEEKTNHIYHGGENQWNREYNSAWHITRIVSPNAKDNFTFHYVVASNWLYPVELNKGPTNISRNTGSGACTGGNSYSFTGDSEYRIRQVYLNQIKRTQDLDQDLVAQLYWSSADRRDVPGLKKLDAIKIFNGYDNGQISRAVLHHGYFGNQSLINTSQSKDYNKLKLNSVDIYGSINSVTPKTYSFEYHNPNSLPPRTSKGMDYWGYYNGANGNQNLIPDPDGVLNVATANRDPSLAYSKIGALTKVHYPTGGHTELTYSLHYVMDASTSSSSGGCSDGNIGLINMNGGVDNNNPYNYCDDGMAPAPPKGANNSFVIDRSANAQVIDSVYIQMTGNGLPDGAQEVIIYKANGAFDFCTLFNSNGNNPPIMFWNAYYNQGTNTYGLATGTFPEGTYQIMVLNNTSSVNINMWAHYNQCTNGSSNTNNTAIARGGLRVIKTVDRTSTASNSDALTKYYVYSKKLITPNYRGHLPTISEAILTSTDMSSAVEHAPLRFVTEAEQITEANTCTRSTHHANNTVQVQGPPIAYSYVSEIIYKNNALNGFTSYEFYNDKEPNQKVPFSKQQLLNGMIKTVTQYDNYRNKIQEEINSYTIKHSSSVHNSKSLGIALFSNRTYVGVRRDYQDYITQCNTTKFGTFCNDIPIPDAYSFDFYPWTADNQWDPFPPNCYAPFSNCVPGTYPDYEYNYYYHSQRWTELVRKVTKQFFDNSPNVISSIDYTYDANHLQMVSTITEGSADEEIETKYYYPDDYAQLTDISSADRTRIQNLGSAGKHHINKVVRTERYNEGTKIFTQQTLYRDETSNRTLDASILTSKGSNPLEARIQIIDYDNYGNVRELSKENGTHVVILYGYEHRLPIAQIVNATHAQVLIALNKTIDPELHYLQNMSDAQLRTEVDKIRNHSTMTGAQVTTFTHKVGVGMSSTEDPKGLIQYYFYDGHNRLEYVKDKDNKILSKNTYHIN